MKRIGIILLTGIILIILLSSCSTHQRVVYRDCNCNTTTFGLGMGWNYNPHWGWGSWHWNYPFWGWGNQIVIVPQRFRQIPPPPTRYDRRRIITPPPTQSVRPQNRSITPTPQRRVVPGNDNVYPNREPIYRNSTTPNRSRIQNRTNPTHRVPMGAPPRYGTPSRVGGGIPNNRSIPQRGGRGNE